MINIVNASCKVAELPQRLLRRVAVSLSQNETILLRVLLAAEGVPGPFRPQEDVDEKASDPAKKRIAKRRVPASCVRCATAQIIAKHARRTGQPAVVTIAADGQPTRATNRGAGSPDGRPALSRP